MAFLSIGDRGEPLRTTLTTPDANGRQQPVDLTGHTVDVAFRKSYGSVIFTSPAVPDANQTTNKGVATWTPGATDLANRVPGEYRVLWVIDRGLSTQITIDGGTIELRKGSGSYGAYAYASYALTTVERVKQLSGAMDDQDSTPDDLIVGYINSASRQIIDYAEREFAPPVSAQTRTFISSGGVVILTPSDLRTATQIQTMSYAVTPLVTTLTLDDYYLGAASLGGTFQVIHAPGVRSGTRVDVTGDWGFATVPADVADACADQVLFWYRGNQQERTGLASVEADTDASPNGTPLRLSAPTRALLDSAYRPIAVA